MRPVPVAQRRVHLATAVLPFVVLAALLVWSAPAGAAQDRRGGEVRMTWAGDVDNIDPAIADAGSSLIVHGATQELAEDVGVGGEHVRDLGAGPVPRDGRIDPVAVLRRVHPDLEGEAPGRRPGGVLTDGSAGRPGGDGGRDDGGDDGLGPHPASSDGECVSRRTLIAR